MEDRESEGAVNYRSSVPLREWLDGPAVQWLHVEEPERLSSIEADDRVVDWRFDRGFAARDALAVVGPGDLGGRRSV